MNILFQRYKQVKGLVFFSYIYLVSRFRILTNNPIYHVIGDSHSTSFLDPAFVIHHIGPATAYKLSFEKSTTRSREKVLEILNKIYKQKKLNVIFVFGELDVRLQINKIANEKNLPISKVINSTVNSYLNFLKLVKDKYPLINIYVLNVLPQGEEKNIYNVHHYASRDMRSSIALETNKELKAYAKKENFKFIEIYDKLIDKSGQRKKEYVFDEVHYNRKITRFIIDELK